MKKVALLLVLALVAALVAGCDECEQEFEFRGVVMQVATTWNDDTYFTLVVPRAWSDQGLSACSASEGAERIKIDGVWFFDYDWPREYGGCNEDDVIERWNEFVANPRELGPPPCTCTLNIYGENEDVLRFEEGEKVRAKVYAGDTCDWWGDGK